MAKTYQEISKTQKLRLLDVWAFAPMAIGAGVYVSKRSTSQAEDLFSVGLIGMGIGTLLFNGKNYLAQRELLNVQ